MRSSMIHLSGLLASSLLCSGNPDDQVAANIDYGSFKSPSAIVRPRFRYWLPDASVDPDIVQQNIKSAGSIGAGGVEFLPFYNYGGQAGGVPPGADWSKYGFGTYAFKNVFLAALKAHKEAGLGMDFAFGPNQGQGVPAESDNEGLMWDLAPFSTEVSSNGLFDGVIPGWGAGELVALVSAEIVSSQNFSLPAPAAAIFASQDSYTRLKVKEDSLTEWTDQVSSAGQASLDLSGGSTRLFAFYQRLNHEKNLEYQANVSKTIFDNGSYIVDHYSSRGANVIIDFWENHLLKGEARDLLMQVGTYGWEDSVEITSNISWTPSLPEAFKAKYGYNLRKYLPLVMFGDNNINIQSTNPGAFQCVLNTPDQGQGYVNDFRGVLVDLYRQYLETLRTWLNSRLSLQMSAQVSYNLPMDMEANVPEVNAPECESLQFSDNVDGYRRFVGPANVAGKRVISNEMGARFHEAYRYYLSELLWSINRALVGGVNRFVLHGESYTGNYYGTTWPGYTAFSYLFSDLYSDKQPSWDNGFSDVMAYVSRMQYLQQKGVLKTDVAIYNKVSATNPNFPTLYQSDNLVNQGYTYSYLSPENFALPQATVEGGMLAADGPAYRALLIDSTSNMTLDGAHHIKKYARSGLPVIFSGGDPGCYLSGDGSDCADVQMAVASLKTVRNVYSVSAGGVAEKLRRLGISPRVEVRTNGTWYPTWREEFCGEEYALIFADGNASTGEVDIASTRRPYFFDSWSGESKPVFNYQQDDGRTVIPLQLAGNQTVVIGFRDDDVPFHATQTPENVQGYEYSDNGVTLHVSADVANTSLVLSTGKQLDNPATNVSPASQLSSWTLTAEHWDAPANMSDASIIADKHNTTHQLDSLISWTEIPGLANASGVGYYTTTLYWPPQSGSADGAYILLPRILHACRLFINGNRVPPFDYSAPKADIGEYLHPGQNDVLAVVPTVMWNYIRSIFGRIENAGLPPLLSAVSSNLPDLSDNGLIGTVHVVPYVKVNVDST